MQNEKKRELAESCRYLKSLAFYWLILDVLDIQKS